jgi:hypothetical protein
MNPARVSARISGKLVVPECSTSLTPYRSIRLFIAIANLQERRAASLARASGNPASRQQVKAVAKNPAAAVQGSDGRA